MCQLHESRSKLQETSGSGVGLGDISTPPTSPAILICDKN